MPPVMTADDRHRAQPEQQAEARAERGAGEDDEEEDAAAAAGQVEQAEQPGDGGEHAEDRDGGAVHRAPPHLEGDGGDDERADGGGDQRRVAGVGLAREAPFPGSQNGYRNAPAPTTITSA